MKTANRDSHYHSAWISDVHLGAKDCKAEYLLDFLSKVKMDKLFLVGDIVDLWSLKRRFHWPRAHCDLIHKFVELAANGTKVYFIPGNHDAGFRKYLQYGWPKNIEIHKEYHYDSLSGKRLLVVHGDRFDGEVCLSQYYTWLGDKLYDFILFLNRQLHFLRRITGRPYWSLSSYIKANVNKAMDAIGRYKLAVRSYAREKGFDGIICGHIHHPELSNEAMITYCNLGDWVENCTAVVEDHDGKFRLLHYTQWQAEQGKVERLENRIRAA